MQPSTHFSPGMHLLLFCRVLLKWSQSESHGYAQSEYTSPGGHIAVVSNTDWPTVGYVTVVSGINGVVSAVLSSAPHSGRSGMTLAGQSQTMVLLLYMVPSTHDLSTVCGLSGFSRSGVHS